jgi:hypothetical protein
MSKKTYPKPENIGVGQEELATAAAAQKQLESLGIQAPPELIAKIEALASQTRENLPAWVREPEWIGKLEDLKGKLEKAVEAVEAVPGAKTAERVAPLKAQLEKVERALNEPKDYLHGKSRKEYAETVSGPQAGTNELSPERQTELLAVYREQYNSLPDDKKSLCPWVALAQRLSGEKLKLAGAMQGGGQLFGIDKEGKALFRDKGVEPVMYGYDKDGKLLQIYDRDPKEMKKVVKWANYFKIRDAVRGKDGNRYELFVDDGNGNFGDEMEQAQVYTKEPFIASRDRKEWRVSWLESGDKPVPARYVGFDPADGHVYVGDDRPGDTNDDYGAVRLLRV